MDIRRIYLPLQVTLINDPHDQLLLLRRTARHDIGHMLGLQLKNRDSQFLQLLPGSSGPHCSNNCTVLIRPGAKKDDVLSWVDYLRWEEELYAGGLYF